MLGLLPNHARVVNLVGVSASTGWSVADLMRTFPDTSKHVQLVQPQQYGLKNLGHLNWFRNSHQVVWPLIVETVRG